MPEPPRTLQLGCLKGAAGVGGSAGLTYNALVLTCELYSSRPQRELRVLPSIACKGLGSLNPNVAGLKYD